MSQGNWCGGGRHRLRVHRGRINRCGRRGYRCGIHRSLICRSRSRRHRSSRWFFSKIRGSCLSVLSRKVLNGSIRSWSYSLCFRILSRNFGIIRLRLWTLIFGGDRLNFRFIFISFLSRGSSLRRGLGSLRNLVVLLVIVKRRCSGKLGTCNGRFRLQGNGGLSSLGHVAGGHAVHSQGSGCRRHGHRSHGIFLT